MQKTPRESITFPKTKEHLTQPKLSDPYSISNIIVRVRGQARAPKNLDTQCDAPEFVL